MNILFVCTGNICRSPLAEGILRNKFLQHNIQGIVDSCGFETFHIGDSPDHRAQKIARANEIEISGHQARMFQVRDFDRFDRIYVMDSYHFQSVMRIARNQNDRDKVDFIMNTVKPGSNMPVKDPYYDHNGAFKTVFNQLEEACDTIVQSMASVRI
ncbi:MAG: low molecular weight protein-tyrosine-phosphatase [bacterium]